MSQHTADDNEPIYTTTRAPPAESADRVSKPTVDGKPEPDDEPIRTARLMPGVSRSG